MYDKVKLFLPRMAGTPDPSQYLSEGKEQTDLNTGEVCTFGSLDGLKVSVYAGGISVCGSFAKYFFSDNLHTLDRHTTAQAIEKISDALHLDMSGANVTELEYGTTFVMRHEVGRYFSKLGDMPKMLRLSVDSSSVYYRTQGRQQPKTFVFYDKIADAKAKGVTLPVGFEGANLLRYEMRYKGRLAHQFRLPEVTASTLSEVGFYKQMMKLYQQNYFEISKLNQVKTNAMNEIKTVSDAFSLLVAKLISQSDQSQIAEFLEDLKEAKVFEDRKNYTRLRKKIQEVASKGKATVTDELIRELDDEIMNVGAYV